MVFIPVFFGFKPIGSILYMLQSLTRRLFLNLG